MDIWIDLNTKAVEFGSIGNTEKQLVKIRQTEDIRLKFHRGGVVELITASDALFIGLKQTKDSADTLASQSTWSHAASTAAFYTCALDLNTSQITTDIFDVADSADELEVWVEITRTPSGGTVRRYDDARITLTRSTFTGDEGTPSDADAAASLIWLATNGILRLKDVTGLTGGGTTNLDGVTSITALGSYVCLDISDVLQDWELISSTAATDASAGLIRHANYATTTFERVWSQRR